MLESIVRLSLRHRIWVLVLTGALALSGFVFGRSLELDALPDVTGNLVVVLTTAPGFSPEEVERLVSRPIETALGGLPGVERQRSISRYGISAVSVLFDEATLPFLARQFVQERLNAVAGELPEGVDPPALGPYTGGLGEIFHFTLSSSIRTREELLALARERVAPILRSVTGVVEANTWGGAVRTYDVVADPVKLAARGVSLKALEEALRDSIDTRPGATLSAGASQVFLRGVARPERAAELADRVIFVRDDEPGHAPVPLRVGDLARVEEGSLPRLGSATANGRGETVYVMVQMLRGANALEVMHRLKTKLPDLRAALAKDVRIDVVYDRSTLVEATLHTVFKNLIEGGLLVVAVLFLALGSFRAGALVASAIPLSMVGAVAGMVFLGVPGNLMSLGAIDFGLLVDGAVVMVESFFHHADEAESDAELEGSIARVAVQVARPVFYSVLIILLVYVPVLTLTGVDGKMFRPMALTVVLALATSLFLVLTFIPAVSSMVLRKKDIPHGEPRLIRWARRLYDPQLGFVMRHPVITACMAALLLMAGAAAFLGAGSSFVPQLDEGDLVIQSTRAPDISLESAVQDGQRLEAALLSGVPEVKQVVSRIGSPAVATDIMGLEQADVFVELHPKSQWRPGLDKEALVKEMEALLTEKDPGAELAFTQPIQMRFNELVGGETADVAVAIFGQDLDELRQLAERALRLIEDVPGAEDARITVPPASMLAEVRPSPLLAAQRGFGVGEVLDAVSAIRAGIPLGHTFEGLTRIPIRLRLDVSPSAFGLGSVGLPSSEGRLVPLAELGEVREVETPSSITHENGERRIVVGFNVRSASLGDVALAAQATLRSGLPLPSGYRLEWGGQYRSLVEARARMAVVIPVALVLILAILIFTFRALRPALIILLNVPFAGVGGALFLAARGLPISISAAIGFIALSGIAVLNGVVLMTKLLEIERSGRTPREAAREAAETRLRPVLMTALVAALGFVPMMLARGVGAEVQRPLATVVVGGLVTSTALTLLILPSLYGALGDWLLRRRQR